jgi:hypothetical protein
MNRMLIHVRKHAWLEDYISQNLSSLKMKQLDIVQQFLVLFVLFPRWC